MSIQRPSSAAMREREKERERVGFVDVWGCFCWERKPVDMWISI